MARMQEVGKRTEPVFYIEKGAQIEAEPLLKALNELGWFRYECGLFELLLGSQRLGGRDRPRRHGSERWQPRVLPMSGRLT